MNRDRGIRRPVETMGRDELAIPRVAHSSIELKLPLVASGLLLTVIASLTIIASLEVRRATLSVAAERQYRVTRQIADLLEASVAQARGRLDGEADGPVFRAFLTTPSDRNRENALAALAYDGPQPSQVAARELRDSAGVVLLSTSEARLADARSLKMDLEAGRKGIAVGELRARGDSVVYPAIVPVESESASGYLIEWRYAASSPESRAMTSEIIGSESSLYLGNTDGGFWTDLERRVTPPAFDRFDSTRAYTRAGLGRRIGRLARIPGTQWVVLLEFSHTDVLAPVGLFLRRILAAVVLVAIVALFVVWWLSHRLTRPLHALAKAAHATSTGDYTQRVDYPSRDEIGMVAQAFNEMASRVQGAHERMEARVEERTRELNATLVQLQQQEQSLSEAKEGAERANHAKSHFLAKMSHELRTPLNSIIGFSEVLQDRVFGDLNDKQGQYVTNVLTSGRQLLDLINDILDLSKVEVGRMQLHLERVALEPLLTEMMGVVDSLASRKRIGLRLDVDADLPPAWADAAKVKQIMYNLVGNAIKFTREDGQVRVTAGRATPTNGTDAAPLEIAVEDTGIGIAPRDLERVFDEFEQVDNTYAREQTGTGLGLALTRRLVQLHGGEIRVVSELGVGSTFRFTLPTGAAMPLADGPATPTDPGPPAETQRPLVLIVDDDPTGGGLIEHYLAHAGYRTERAQGGEQALVMARELQPAVITLDILLPDLHGHEVLSRLKAAPETSRIPVVVVSVTEDRALGMSLGAADWFVKPARRDEFLGAIHRTLGRRERSGNATVLVIDDEPQTVAYLTDILTHEGFRVIATTDGTEAIRLALDGKPDAIVVDLLMPDVSGFDVVREIRSHPRGRNIPIVVFTTKDLTREEDEDLRGRVQAIVPKGSGREDLLHELAVVSSQTTAVLETEASG